MLLQFEFFSVIIIYVSYNTRKESIMSTLYFLLAKNSVTQLRLSIQIRRNVNEKDDEKTTKEVNPINFHK